jgi:poly(A) polymerase
VSSVTTRLDDAGWLHERRLARILAVLNRDGEEARVVGGAVRNALLGLSVGEVDIATTATPDEVCRRVAAAGLRPVPTGIEHGTVTAVVEGHPFEVTTLRQDIETYGRHARVAFGRDWKADAERRDFTMNALSVTPDGTVHDYVGGLDDLAARRLRFIGEPALRIAEDYLRILRFFRFYAAYGRGEPDAEGLHACIAARDGLAQLSRERVRMELMKLLVAEHAMPTLAIMSEAGILLAVLGGVAYLASFANMGKVQAAIGAENDPVQRLGALGAFIAEDAERLWQRLRLTNEEHGRLSSMAEGWWRVRPDDMWEGRALLYRLGPERFVDRVLVAWTRSPAGANEVAWHELATLPLRWTAPVFPLKAADFVRRGVERGPSLGQSLRAAEAAWLAADMPMDQAALSEIADRSAVSAR